MPAGRTTCFSVCKKARHSAAPIAILSLVSHGSDSAASPTTTNKINLGKLICFDVYFMSKNIFHVKYFTRKHSTNFSLPVLAKKCFSQKQTIKETFADCCMLAQKVQIRPPPRTLAYIHVVIA